MEKKIGTTCYISLLIITLFIGGCTPSKELRESTIPRVQEKVSEMSMEEERQVKLYEMAEQEYKDGKFEQAIIYLEDYLSRFPSSSLSDDALLKLGEIYLVKRDYEKAVGAYQMLLRDFPTSDLYGEARLQLALSHLKFDDFQESIRILKSMMSGPLAKEEKVRVYGLLAENYDALDEDVTAISWYMKVLEISDHEEQTGRIEVEIKKIINFDLSRNELLDVIDLYSEKFPSGFAYFKLAELYFLEGSLTDARETILHMLNEYPEHEYGEQAQDLLDRIDQRSRTDTHAIGCILPLSGKFSVYGEKALHGIELAADVFNPSPEDSPIKLVIKDSRGEPETAARAVEELVLEDNVICIIGPLLSKTADAAARTAEGFHIPIMVLSPKKNITEIGEYVFRNSMTPELQTEAIVDYAIGFMGFEKFAILYPDNQYGDNFMNLFWDEVLRLGGEIVGAESYHTEQNDFQDEIKKLVGLYYVEDRKAQMEAMEAGEDETAETEDQYSEEELSPIIDFDALFIPDYFHKVGLIVPQLVYYDVVGIQLLGISGWNSSRLIDMAGEYVEGAVFVDGFFRESPYPFAKKFIDDFQSTFGEEPEILEAQAYDSGNMVIDLIRQQGIESREELKESIYRINDYPGVSGATTFDGTGDSQKILYTITIENGNFVQLR